MPKEGKILEDMRIRKYNFKIIIKKTGFWAWIGLIWLTIRMAAGSWEQGNKSSGFIKGRKN
jgi:hypothetical protein